MKLQENTKQAKQLVAAGKLSEDALAKLIEIDPTEKNKYVGWIAKQVVEHNADFDDLRNTVEEFNEFLEKGKAKTRDVYQFKTLEDMKKEVHELNQSGFGISVRDLENDYEEITDIPGVYIAIPHTHEASRKLGLSKFQYRDCGNGQKDSSWCTTYKAADHFTSYYYNNNITFYYIRITDPELLKKVAEALPNRGESIVVTAFAVFKDGRMDVYDGKDRQLSRSEIDTYTSLIGIS